MKRAPHIVVLLTLVIIFSACSDVEKTYWENGNIKSELPYKNAQLNGTAIWYYEDGTVQMEVPYEYDEITGTSIRYHDNGRKELEETYINNVRQGKAIAYSYPGKRVEQKYYVNDTLHGKYSKWHGNSELQISGELVNGLFEGTWLYYDDYGDLIGEGKYESGNGVQRFWNPDGSLASRTTYVNNLKHGKEFYYKPDGEIDYVVEYANGEPVVE
jgi:antitoxin component YwqK of YwqJK toxin-antitoxin module